MKQISESCRNYIRAISELMRENNGTVRKTDLAKALGYSKPSVTAAVRRLEKDGYVVQNNGTVVLTESGKEISDGLQENRMILEKLFVLLGDDKEDAAENAGKMERIISNRLILIMKETLKRNHMVFAPSPASDLLS